MNFSKRLAQLDRALVFAGTHFQSVLLLLLRLWWGWSFFLTGKGKLMNLDKTTEFFAGLGLPVPKLQAIAAGSVECVGGLLLLVGFCSRAVSVPLIFTMLVAYGTAHRDELTGIFNDPDAFTGAAPFLFLLATLVVFAFGPGKLSVDALLKREGGSRSVEPTESR